ncbi:hypothetical protein BDZ89DRAFT_945829 [Hymenopellis radicata]|nr:hypothetical protein BDZ89DRAFT_945829 [Hymenopellis radicata]
MPIFTISIEDYSPLISYSPVPPWRPGKSDGDSLFDKYSDNSFTLSDTNGSTALFSFNGTSVRIYGAKRGNHGDYQVTVDGKDYPPMSGTANESTFESTEVLFTATLDPGLHNVSVVNLGSADPKLQFFDIDFVEWDTFIDGEDGPIVDTVQDTDAAFSYSPVSAWDNNTEHSGFFMGLTGHTSSQSSSFFALSFSGIGVSLFGPIGPDCGNYVVELDGGPGEIFSASNVKFRPQVPLYHAVGLPSGPHSLKVTSLSTSAGAKTLAIDYANVFRHPASESA